MTEPGPDRLHELPAEFADALRAPFDHLLTDPVRLRIQAALVALPAGGSMRFTTISRTLGISDGNLGSHLAVLAEVGYVDTEVTWRGKRRTTWYRVTEAGREAFERHVAALRGIVGPPV
ncbi:transcriptional regulator [Occultella gossypii]|uniref:Transcriptional regulator n=1 Tax=Occultella gossypii TaxID=2800820 RepID=A0ABS7S8L4_9MICO|nr:transcriptional regulator [Occultella gossypii]MBZ2196642.1 transcriptional regulator [Occultella gossypii]